MMNKPLRELINNRFQQESLSADQFAELQKMIEERREDSDLQQDDSEMPRRNRIPSRQSLMWVVAASLLLIFVPLYWFPAENMAEKIAREVAMNHIKMKPLELESQSMEQLAGFFTQLDFNLINSKVFNLNEQQMLGGRYCSIQGITAAQLRYVDEHGRLVTLYETYYEEDLFSSLPNADKGEPPLKLHTKGLQVSIWIEKDLVFVAASTDDTSHSTIKQ